MSFTRRKPDSTYIWVVNIKWHSSLKVTEKNTNKNTEIDFYMIPGVFQKNVCTVPCLFGLTLTSFTEKLSKLLKLDLSQSCPPPQTFGYKCLMTADSYKRFYKLHIWPIIAIFTDDNVQELIENTKIYEAKGPKGNFREVGRFWRPCLRWPVGLIRLHRIPEVQTKPNIFHPEFGGWITVDKARYSHENIVKCCVSCQFSIFSHLERYGNKRNLSSFTSNSRIACWFCTILELLWPLDFTTP